MKSQPLWDDGSPVDRTRSSFSTDSSKRSIHKKEAFAARDAAVCRQAQRTLLMELMGVPGITSVEVRPVAGAARLQIEITAAPGELPAVRDRLLQRSAALRHAIAASLRRRKAPELCFSFLPEGGGR